MQGEATNVFNIQRFCTHDGPGIRTVIFLKGCPLQCVWCSNPESQSTGPELLFDARKCIGCGRCTAACPQAIPAGRQGVGPKCIHCGRCAEACPSEALEAAGRPRSISDILEEVVRDEEYYYPSGGVTISGGEPLMHPGFVCALADAIKGYGYHLALETTGFAPWETADRVFAKFDLLLFDLKHMDDTKHRLYTGQSNRPILENAERAAQKGYPILIRVPLIGGYNDDEENISRLAEFCASAGLARVEFLPYHSFGASKYTLLRREYGCNGGKPELAVQQRLAAILEARGIAVRTGQ